MRTAERTLVTLDTVLHIPNRNECLHTTLVVSGCACLPCTVSSVELNEVRNLQQVTGLSVHRANNLLHECGSVGLDHCVISEVCPSGVNSQLLILATAINGGVVLVDHILTLLAVRLHDELLHLLHSELSRNHLSDAEEC